ncbi:MAG: hypothetical protein R6W80_18105 [Haliea sp.]
MTANAEAVSYPESRQSQWLSWLTVLTLVYLLLAAVGAIGDGFKATTGYLPLEPATDALNRERLPPR